MQDKTVHLHKTDKKLVESDHAYQVWFILNNLQILCTSTICTFMTKSKQIS